MAAYPDVQKRVHEELDRVIGRERPVHRTDRGKRVFRPLVRLYTTSPSAFHISTATP